MTAPGSTFVDHYQVLGVSRCATETQIKDAFRHLAKSEHPDRGGNHERFVRILRAYEVLTNPEQRRHYDEHLRWLDDLDRLDAEQTDGHTGRSSNGASSHDAPTGHDEHTAGSRTWYEETRRDGQPWAPPGFHRNDWLREHRNGQPGAPSGFEPDDWPEYESVATRLLRRLKLAFSAAWNAPRLSLLAYLAVATAIPPESPNPGLWRAVQLPPSSLASLPRATRNSIFTLLALLLIVDFLVRMRRAPTERDRSQRLVERLNGAVTFLGRAAFIGLAAIVASALVTLVLVALVIGLIALIIRTGNSSGGDG